MNLPRLVLLIFSIGCSTATWAQSPADEEAVRRVADRFVVAWNTHDMNILGSISTDDIDFVNVAGLHWSGREQVVREHADRHKVRFKDSVMTNKNVRVQLLRADIALVHIDWETRGDLGFDLKPWPPRKGIFSWLVVKERGEWKIRSAQNTDSTVPVGGLGTADANK